MLIMNNLNSLLQIIDEIDIKKFPSMSDINNELDNILYIDICTKFVISNFIKWQKSNMHHSFPKYEKNWINMFRNQTNLRSFHKKYDVNKIINNIINKAPIPFYHKYMYNRIVEYMKTININNITTKNIEEIDIYSYIIFDITPEDVIKILTENQILYKYGQRLSISPFYIRLSEHNDCSNNDRITKKRRLE